MLLCPAGSHSYSLRADVMAWSAWGGAALCRAGACPALSEKAEFLPWSSHRIPTSPSHRFPTSPSHRIPSCPSHRFPSCPSHRIPTCPSHRIPSCPSHSPFPAALLLPGFEMNPPVMWKSHSILSQMLILAIMGRKSFPIFSVLSGWFQLLLIFQRKLCCTPCEFSCSRFLTAVL